MGALVRSATRLSYSRVAKPLLFRFHPDTVHKNTIRFARWAQVIPGLRGLPKLWSYHDDKILSQEIAGTVFHNPVGLAAGFDKNICIAPLMKSVGFGWMTGGSVTEGTYKGNDGSWYYRLPKSKSLVVNAGLPSEGARAVAKRVSNYDKKLFVDFPLCVSVAKTNSKASISSEQAIDDYCAGLARFNELPQVKTLEINISCPNTFGGEPFTTPELLEKLLLAVDGLHLTKPVFVKMPINLKMPDFDKLLDIIIKRDIQGVTISNLFKDRSAVQLAEVLPDNVAGNLSGTPTKQQSTRLISHTYKRHGDRLIIIGVGGIFTAEDAYEKICAGASLVGLITGLIFEGPQLVGDINAGLVKLLKRDGCRKIEQAVGSHHRIFRV